MAGADLESLIIWNIVIASMLHIGCGVLAHSLHSWIRGRLKQLEETLKSARCGAASDQAVHEAVSVAEQDASEVAQALQGHAVEIEASSVAAAKDEIKRILAHADWSHVDPDERAKVVVEVLAATLNSLTEAQPPTTATSG
jgi:hypothetical protein